MRLGLALLMHIGLASASSFEHYDLDSLIWASSEVVEAEYLGDHRARVLRCFFGAMEVGAVMRCPMLDARTENGASIALGDNWHVVLFRRSDGSLVSSGEWLVFGGRVHRPIQVSDPGARNVWLVTDSSPEISDFYSRLPSRVRNVQALKARLQGVPSLESLPQLLELLRERCAMHAGPDEAELRRCDLVALAVCEYLAAVRNPDALACALQLQLGWKQRLCVARGFGTPKGREELLQRIGDTQASPEHRLRLAAAIADADPIFRSVWTVSKGRWDFHPRTAGTGNSGYLRRVAMVARSLVDDESLCATLCQEIRQCPRADPEVMKDLDSAAPVLIQIHNSTSSEWVRFEAARALAAIGTKAHTSLDSSSRYVLGRLSEPRISGKEVHFRWECYARVQYDAVAVILAQGTTQAEIRLRNTRLLNPQGLSSMVGSLTMPIPQDAVPGRYRAWVRFYMDDVCAGESYGCVVTLTSQE